MKFNKLIWILSIIFLLSVGFVSAVPVAPDSADVVAYWTLDNLLDSTSNDYDLTNNGATSGVSGIIDNAYSLDGTNDFIDSEDFELTSDFSISGWFYADSISNGDTLISKWANSLATRSYILIFLDNKLRFDTYEGTTIATRTSSSTVSSGSWYHVVITHSSGSNFNFYLNGVLDNGASSGTLTTINTNSIVSTLGGERGGDGTTVRGYFDGVLDEWSIYDVALSSDNVEFLHATGSPDSEQQHPFSSGSSESPPFSVTASDYWDDSSINSFWAYINGTNYTTTNGTITTPLLQNDTNTYSLSVGASDYFTETYSDLNISTNKEALLHQSEISFASFEYISNNSISSCNYTISGIQNTTFYLSEADDYVVLVECPSYYPVNHTFNVSALDIKTVNVTGLYNSIMNVNLTDVITTDLIESTSYVTVDNNDGFEQTYSNSDGSISVTLVQDDYSLTLWADNYAYRYVNVTLDETVENFAYALYSNNSLWVIAEDQSTGVSLNNFTVEVFNTNSSYSSSDNNTGTIRLNNITSGVYTVRVDKDGYAVAEYALTMTGGSHQSFTAYLVASGSTTIFTVVDSISGGIIEGASASMYKTINSTWTLVSAQDTDITGRVQYTYIPNIEYKFIIDAVGYEQREFFLKPLFSTYTIRLTPDVSSIPDENTGSYVYAINNSGLFYDDKNNSVEISIYSGTGTIEYYYLNVTNYDDSVSSFNCLTAQGCSDSLTLEITDALFNDSVVVEYWIKESGRSEKYFRIPYFVQDIYDPSTLEGWKDVDDEDVDDLSKAFIVTIIMLIVVGLVSLGSIAVGAPPITVSGFVLGVLVEVFAYVGFIPSLAGHLVALGCLLIVLFGRGEL